MNASIFTCTISLKYHNTAVCTVWHDYCKYCRLSTYHSFDGEICNKKTDTHIVMWKFQFYFMVKDFCIFLEY